MFKKENLQKILPQLLTFATGHRRYKPTIQWATKCWTHNFFRAYEAVFYRKAGIRREARVTVYTNENGERIVKRSFYTVEAFVAHIEGVVRQALNYESRTEIIKTYFELKQNRQQFALVMSVLGIAVVMKSKHLGMVPMFAGFAIAYGASNTSYANGTTSQSASLAISGSDRFIYASGGYDSPATVSSLTHDSVGMTSYGPERAGGGARRCQMWALIAPNTGTHNTVVNFSGSTNGGFSASYYTGVSQTSQPNNETGNASGGTSVTATTTVGVNNSWLIAVERDDFGSPTAGTGTRLIAGMNFALLDSNGTVAAGSRSLAWTYGGSASYGYEIAVINPPSTNYTQSLPEVITLVATHRKDFTKGIIDTITLAVTIAVSRVITIVFNESIALIETLTARITGTTRAFVETITLVSSVTARFTARYFNETITLVAALAKTHNNIRAFVESISLNAVLGNVIAYGRSFVESLTLEIHFRGLLNGKDMRYVRKYINSAKTYFKKYLDF